MNSMHLIIERIPKDFPLFIGKAEFDLVKFLKWNNLVHPEIDNKNEIIQIPDSELDFSNDKIHRRKKERKEKNEKKEKKKKNEKNEKKEKKEKKEKVIS